VTPALNEWFCPFMHFWASSINFIIRISIAYSCLTSIWVHNSSSLERIRTHWKILSWCE
jgi:hypothetical protein